MAWSPTNPWTPVVQSDFPQNFWSQFTFFNVIGRFINWLATLIPVTAAGTFTFSGPAVGTPVSHAVNFPTGRFSSTPMVTVSITGSVTDPSAASVTASGKSSTGFTIYVTRTASGGTPVTVDWIAVASP